MVAVEMSAVPARPAPSIRVVRVELAVEAPHAVLGLLAGLLVPKEPQQAELLRRRFERARERRSVVAGQGVLLVRSSLAHLSSPRVAYARLRRPMGIRSPDGAPVTDVLALVVPQPTLSAEHEMLTALERWLRLPAAPSRLRACDGEDQLRDLLIEATCAPAPWAP